MSLLAPYLILIWSVAVGPTPATLEVDVEGLRNRRGLLHLCATSNRSHFPNCKRDPAAHRLTIPATQRPLRLTGLAPGRYAVSLIHDENSNAKLDSFLGVPREGFGFSRNPVIRFGAPKFDSVDIELAPGFARTRVRVQYLL